jgi:3-hydroxybutyryl-CoA dehydrogenase
MKIKNVTVAGGGTLGSQISWQCALMGFNVIVYDAFEKGLEASKLFHKQYAELFNSERDVSTEEIERTNSRISYSTDLAEAIKDADLLSESVPENLDIKKEFYQKVGQLAPEKTIFTTNTSTMLPSNFAKDTGRPEKFLALHFANPIWEANIGEVMGHSGTSQKVFKQVVEFAEQMGMIPIPIHKEQNGYIINSLLIPWLNAAGDLLVNEITAYQNIDKTWMISTGMAMGPCGVMDLVGIDTLHKVEKHWGEVLNDPEGLKRATYYKKKFIDKGNLGMKTGEGFYSYPNPKYQYKNFLS